MKQLFSCNKITNIYFYLNILFLRALLSILVLWVLIATIVDITIRILEFLSKLNDPSLNEPDVNVVVKKKTTSRSKTFLIECSIYSNTEKFLRTDNGGSISCLNGIRFFSMVWIIWGHTYNYIIERKKFFVVGNLKIFLLNFFLKIL